jgi:4-amino-4-deoxy-L-arabinose transferase-like glycosyltransferase
MNPQENTVVPLKRIAWIFVALAAVGLILRLINIGNPLNSWDGFDEMNYALIARSLMDGELPFHGPFDHKPIALYYIFALFFQVFGYTLAAIRLMPFAVIALTSWLLFRIARKQLSPHQHLVALGAILFMTTCASFGNGGHASNTEILQMPIVAAWWLVACNYPESSWRRPLLFGALAGLAAQINYLGGFVLAISTALMLAWPLFTRDWRKALVPFLAGGVSALAAFIAVGLLMLAPLIVAGDLPQYFHMQFGALSGYQGVVNDDKLVRAILSIAISAGFFASLLACIGWHERSLRGVAPAAKKLLLQLTVVFAVTLFAINLTGRLYPHYFNLLIVPSTLILLTLLASAGARALRSFVFLAALLSTLVVARGAWDVYLKDWSGDFRQRHEIARLTEEIRRHAQPGERVLLLNLNHALYFLADVTPATRFVFRGQIFQDRFLPSIGSSPEREIITALEARPVFVMACFDNIGSAYRPWVEKELAPGYRDYALPGYDECHELKAYYPIANAEP